CVSDCQPLPSCAMGGYTPSLCACVVVLCHTPAVTPLVVGSPPCIVRRTNTTSCDTHHHGAARSSTTCTTRMMATPSTPVPRNIKDTVSSLRVAVQEGLKAQKSRMDVDLPFAARLGVETSDSDDKGKKKYTDADVERADRELARLFLEMFDVIGDQVVVAFPTDEEAKKATKAWNKGVPFKGKVTSMDPRPAKGPKLKRGNIDALVGFASQVEAAKKAKSKNKKGKKGGKQ
ncbi:unnamed protein product, partial [Pylaiella littoralis]